MQDLYHFIEANSYPNKNKQYRMLYLLPNMSKPDFTFNDIVLLYKLHYGASGGGLILCNVFKEIMAIFPQIVSINTKPVTYFSRKEGKDITTEQMLFTINQNTLSMLLTELDRLFAEIDFRGKNPTERKQLMKIAVERLRGFIYPL